MWERIGWIVSEIKASVRRGFLRQIAEGAKKTASPFRDSLLAVQAQIYSPNFQRGRILVSTSGSGQSANFEIGVQGKAFTQENVFGMLEDFIALLDSLAMTDDASPEATDALFIAMIGSDEMATVKEMRGDFTYIGFGYQNR